MFELKPTIEESAGRAAVGRVVRSLPAVAVGALFILVGYTKFNGDPSGEWFRIFERIGLGQWFRVVTGLVQVGGGVLMLFRRTRTAGAAALAATMVGAALVDLVVLGSPLVVVPMMLLFLVVAVWAASE